MYPVCQSGQPGEKEKFAAQFKAFVLSDFARSRFTIAFYRRLSMTFGHIAHYGIGGFYGTFFESAAGKAEFIRQCAEYPCYGEPAWTYCDVEKDLQVWLQDNRILAMLERTSNESRVAADLRQLATLQAKYGIVAVAAKPLLQPALFDQPAEPVVQYAAGVPYVVEV